MSETFLIATCSFLTGVNLVFGLAEALLRYNLKAALWCWAAASLTGAYTLTKLVST